ncbi:hypothetical protein [Flavipsychrobacter stenotrophus]|nr:hypothetical protein [Flavipsychrobacter stenotrophus]
MIIPSGSSEDELAPKTKFDRKVSTAFWQYYHDRYMYGNRNLFIESSRIEKVDTVYGPYLPNVFNSFQACSLTEYSAMKAVYGYNIMLIVGVWDNGRLHDQQFCTFMTGNFGQVIELDSCRVDIVHSWH